MTTAVSIFPQFIHADSKIQLVRRFPESGNETIVAYDMAANVVLTDHVWGDCELVIREVPKEPEPEPAPTAA